jgi:hypothetical protein
MQKIMVDLPLDKLFELIEKIENFSWLFKNFLI